MSSGVYVNARRETCILVKEGRSKAHIVRMSSTTKTVEEVPLEKFAEEFSPLEGYPVGAAAKRYLDHARFTGITDGARRALTTIYHASPSTTETDMSEAQTQEAPKTDAKKGFGAKAEKPAAAKAEKPAAAKAKKPAAAKAEKPAAAKAKKRDDEVKYVVADDSTVKRGALREFVDAAMKMKTFTKTKLLEHFAGKMEEAHLKRHFYWCTSKGIFSEA